MSKKRMQSQAQLARQSEPGDGRGLVKASHDLVAYKNVSHVPLSRELMIQIDKKNEAVILPINGDMVPFHISTIKNVTSQRDNDHNCYIHVHFNFPGAPPSSPHYANTFKSQGLIHLKDVFFRTKDTKHSSEVIQMIKALRHQVMSRESERADRETLVTQEKLQLVGNNFKPIRLSELCVRPTLGGRGRKLTGTLEAHVNGFRYSTPRQGGQVDIMYANVKHAFFQPAEKEMITLLHFHLYNHMMVGNKKTKDIQFYIEVMDVAHTLGDGKRKRFGNDPDEMDEEQRERDRKNMIHKNFQTFVTKVNDLWGQGRLDLEFDQPMREFGFHGVHHKASAFIVPCSSCLVELIETPFLVVSLSEIEIVSLERIGLAQKSFDMTMVFKDLKRDVLRIDSIPSTSLDGIKKWLDIADLKYYESRLNLNWVTILKDIIDDPKEFVKNGGWEFLNIEGSDSESENSEDSDQGYEPSDMESYSSSSSSSEEEDNDNESLVESEEDEEEESEEEKEKTWEELKREASNPDMEKQVESDSEDEKKRGRMKASVGKSRVPDKRDKRGGPPKRVKRM